MCGGDGLAETPLRVSLGSVLVLLELCKLGWVQIVMGFPRGGRSSWGWFGNTPIPSRRGRFRWVGFGSSPLPPRGRTRRGGRVRVRVYSHNDDNQATKIPPHDATQSTSCASVVFGNGRGVVT